MVDRMIQIRELKGRERCWSCFIYLFYLYIHFLKPYHVWDILPCCDRVQDIPRLKKEKKKGYSLGTNFRLLTSTRVGHGYLAKIAVFVQHWMVGHT